jgi:pimeloyl-ACP methyl ester carboxylesterase
MALPHVIALHCSGSSSKQWPHLSQRLRCRNPTWCPDFVGCGANGHWIGDRPFTLADEASPIVSMIDSLAMPVHLVGHSYGGAVALKVARERPSQIASVILYEPMALHVLRTAGPDGWDGSPRSTVFRPTSIAAFSPAIIVQLQGSSSNTGTSKGPGMACASRRRRM